MRSTVMSYIGLALLLAVIVLATLGWLLNRPMTARRAFHRFAAFGCMLALTMIWSIGRMHRGQWPLAVIDAVCAVFWLTGAGRWYGETEKLRAAERESAPVQLVKPQ